MSVESIKIGILTIFIAWSVPLLGLSLEERSAIDAIKKGNIEGVKAYLEKYPGANCEFSNGKTGMYYSIEYGQAYIAEFLLQRGADPGYTVEDHTLLTWAVRYNRSRIARFLIEFGADVDQPDKNSDSPLITAAKHNNLEQCRLLVNYGADPFYKNQQGKTASDYAGSHYESPAYRYLLFIEEMYVDHNPGSSMRDGPYFFDEADGRIVMTYFEHDHPENRTRMIEKTLAVGNVDTMVRGIAPDLDSYHIKQEYVPDTFEFSTTGDIFVLGDIHGKFHALLKILMNNGIIDSSRMWTFGQGHLVLLGDDFDRGEYVTETFWFLHELEIQARKAGGNVHLLLGNHEIMEMTGDDRYLHHKYRYFTQFTRINYSSLYGKNTVLGRWLRSKNIIIQINGNLFLHAGISPQFALRQFSFQEINQRVRDFLFTDYTVNKGSPADIILGGMGPLWYRGYMGPVEDYPEINQGFVDAFLDSKGLRRMIIGHNEQETITATYKGKVISADVAIDESGDSAQGLLISGDMIYKCSSKGIREKLQITE
jgi:hypothetical protein